MSFTAYLLLQVLAFILGIALAVTIVTAYNIEGISIFFVGAGCIALFTTPANILYMMLDY